MTRPIYPFVPDMIKFYLSEEPILPNVPTHVCARESDRKYVLEHLHELVVKSTNESGGYGMLMGHQAIEAKSANPLHRRDQSRPTQFHRPADRAAFAASEPDRRQIRRPSHRPAALHSLWTKGNRHARRIDARGAAKGKPGRQFLARRRIEGIRGCWKTMKVRAQYPGRTRGDTMTAIQGGSRPFLSRPRRCKMVESAMTPIIARAGAGARCRCNVLDVALHGARRAHRAAATGQ